MTNTTNDRLQQTLSGINVDSRLSTWLWLYLKKNHPNASLGELGSHGMRDRMANFIQSAKVTADFIEATSALFLLPEKSLEWITSNNRQNLFITRILIEQYEKLHFLNEKNLPNRALTIAMIDILEIEISQKSQLIYSIKYRWDQHSSSDHIFKWLDGDDTKQKLELAWEIAKNKHHLLPSQQSAPQGKDEFITLIESQLNSEPEKILFMDFIKKRWSQKKYRAKLTDKKQCNFVLSNKAINRLDKLADKHDLKRTEVLEILLQMEEEKGTYITEKKNIMKGVS
ncbi:hypothetical protein [Aquipseudomonas alcaligenes]|uniref:hypothetical protein n=1 Tax=Aquipseudomonas alcaligenes TaxID=43263 RepID=UPI003747F973